MLTQPLYYNIFRRWLDKIMGYDPARSKIARESVWKDELYEDWQKNENLTNLSKIDYIVIKLSERRPFLFVAGVISWVYLIPYEILSLCRVI